MEPDPQDYHSYLLRLWRVHGDGINGAPPWKMEKTGELHEFQDLSAQLEYL